MINLDSANMVTLTVMCHETAIYEATALVKIYWGLVFTENENDQSVDRSRFPLPQCIHKLVNSCIISE